VPVQPVTVTITRATVVAQRASFDTLLLAAAHALPGPRVREYGSLDEAETDGLTAAAYPWIYDQLSVIFSQDPSPSRVLVGRRDELITQVVSIVPTVFGEDYVYELPIEGETASYTVLSGDVLADIITGLVAAVNGLTAPVTAADVGPGTSFTLTCDTPGRVLRIEADPAVYALEHQTADPGIAADLSAFRSEREDFYAIVLDSNSDAEVAAASAWAQTRTILLVADADAGEHASAVVTDDLASTLRDLNRDRTALIYTAQHVGVGYAQALAARALAGWDPGTATWAFKRLTGVAAYDLTTGQASALDDKRLTVYTPVQGAPATVGGYVSGTLEFADVIRGLDFLVDDVRARVTTLILRNLKVPYTDAGIATVASAVLERLFNAVALGILAADPAPATSVPAAADATAEDRAERVLRNVNFTGRLAGAIHEIIIRGTVEV
jgi:hypothetical protein